MTLAETALDGWRRDPAQFIEAVCVDPLTGRPFVLLPAERQFLTHAFERNAEGRLRFPEQVFAAPKESGKTTFAALHMLTCLILFGGRNAEAYAVANDFEQAQGRVFAMVRQIIEASPTLRQEFKVAGEKITFLPTSSTIIPLASDYASAAGGHPTISVFDELWGYVSERSRRLWDEMVQVPTRQVSVRLTVTYAGFEAESDLLRELYQRGLAQPEIAPGLHAGDGLLMFWSHEPIAPWLTDAWLAEMRRSLRPNQYLRMIENRFVTSEGTFVEAADWDGCVDPAIGALPPNRTTQIWVGADASTKRDSTALVGVVWDRDKQCVRVAWHRVFTPSERNPIDFEATIEATLIDMAKKFDIKAVWYDPYQMAASAQRLVREGLKLEEFPQTVGNLTEASQNLFELIKSRSLVLYADEGMRRSAMQSVAVETSRGWRIAKEKTSHKIDVIVALAQAALAAVRWQKEHKHYADLSWISGPQEAVPERTYAAQRLSAYILNHQGYF